MIHQNTIDAINDLSLIDVLSKYVDLKKEGANYKALSPFTDEKSGSFIVSPSKNIWKCFSTGIGGNSAISFLMRKKNQTFTEAIRELASMFSIPVEFDDDEAGKKNIENQERKNELADVNASALTYFMQNLPKITAEQLRTTSEIAELFQIGYAPDEWKGLYQFLINKGISEAAIIESGLCTKTEKGVFDFFRNRVVFPLFNRQKQLVGFSGRSLDLEAKAKYLNTRENKLFKKSEAFIGLDLSQDEIVRTGKVTIVEGNYDVTASWIAGMRNVVAGCGTAFTEEHILSLKKLRVKTALLLFDGDAAGLKAMLKVIELLTMNEVITEVAILPEGMDPDDFFQNNKLQKLDELVKDGIEYYSNVLFDGAESVAARSSAESKLENFLATIGDPKIRKNYIKQLCKTHKINASDIEKMVNVKIRELASEDEEEGPRYNFPRKVTIEEKKDFEKQIQEREFYEDKNNRKMGYWFIGQYKTMERASNFLIRPLFHIFSYSNNRRLVEVFDKDKKAIIEVSSKGFVNVTGFQEEVIKHLNGHWFGNTKQFKYVAMSFMDKMPTAMEITTLGWQNDGFWAFADGIIQESKFKNVDQYGIVRAGSEDDYYFLPAFSSIYKNFREEDDPYESDRAFKYRSSDCAFRDWSAQYYNVHGENGMFGIAYLLAAAFRDFIFSRESFFPILFNFGDVQTGKSKAAQHLNAVLLGEQQPTMLNAATLVSITRKVAQFRNAVVWFDEYTNDLDEKTFQFLKSVWDGAGREKGRMTNDNKTTSTKIYSALNISGQYLPTRDSNSLFTRSIILTFDIKAENRSTDEIKEFQKLAKMSRKGLSNILLEVLKWRDLIIEEYEIQAFDIVKELKLAFQHESTDYNGRVLGNFVVLLTVVKILESKIALPFTYEQLKKKSVSMIANQSEQINDSDVLRSYWKMVEYLFYSYTIEFGKDFSIKTENSVLVYSSSKKTERINFPHDRKVLYIQFKKIHPEYMQAHKKQFGTNGTNESSVQSYMKSHKAFIGVTPNFSFEDKRTSAWMFDYEALDISLERTHGGTPTNVNMPDPSEPKKHVTEQEDIPFK